MRKGAQSSLHAGIFSKPDDRSEWVRLKLAAEIVIAPITDGTGAQDMSPVAQSGWDNMLDASAQRRIRFTKYATEGGLSVETLTATSEFSGAYSPKRKDGEELVSKRDQAAYI